MLAAMSGAISDIDSAANSQYSDIASKLGNVSVTITASDISDIASATATAIGFTPADIATKVWSDYESRIGTTASDANSKAVLAQSRVSDIQSYLVALSGLVSDVHSAAVVAQSIGASDMSDLRSAIAAATAVLSASDISDIASAVKATLASDLSDIYSAAILAASNASDAHSAAVVAQGINNSDMSDLRSAINATTFTLSASNLSDIGSAVRVALASDISDIYSAAQQTNSRALVLQSMVSDVDSAVTSQFNALSGMVSDAHSAAVLAGSYASDAHSQALLASSRASDAHSAALLTQSMVSDVYSVLTTARTEPAQGAPGVSIAALEKLDYLYKWSRNKKDNDGTSTKFYADNGTTVDHTQTTSESAGTVTKGEIVSGP